MSYGNQSNFINTRACLLSLSSFETREERDILFCCMIKVSDKVRVKFIYLPI